VRSFIERLRITARRGRREGGMAMVEMVIILPLLFMVLFAIVEFAVLFGRWQTLSNAAREGARTAVVFRSGCDAATVEAEVRQTVKDYAASLGMSLGDGDIAITGACGASTTSTTVIATFQHDFRVLPNFSESVSSTINLVGSSAMRNEGSS
jgi:Flp pilus assembly protein TadG